MQFILHHASFKKQGQLLLENITLETSDESYFVAGVLGAGKSLLLQALSLKLSLVSGERTTIHQGKHIGISELINQIQLIDFTGDRSFVDDRNGYYQQRYHTGMQTQAQKVNDYLKNEGLNLEDPYHLDLLAKTGLQERLEQPIIQLSNGQLMKMLVVKALMRKPKVLFLDNPFVGLDVAGQNDLHKALHQIYNNLNVQFFMTGRESDVPSFIKNEIQIENRKICAIGEKTKKTKAEAELNKSVAKQIGKLYTSTITTPNSGKVIEAKNITVQYPTKKILDDITFSVDRGDKVALIGNNGSGKSTLLSLLFADHPLAYSNKIYLFGVRRGTGESIWSVKKQIGFVSPELRMYMNGNVTVEETITSGLFDTYHPQKKVQSKDLNFMQLLLAYFELEHLVSRRFSQLSSGEQQLVIFIRALVQHPKLFLLDEPYQGMDWQAVSKCNYLLEELLKGSETTLLFISHFTSEIPKIVDKHLLLEHGKLKQVKKDKRTHLEP